MATAKYYFSCNTVHDWEIIQWLDSFIPRERTMAIKEAIRQYQEETEVEPMSDDRLSEIEKSIKEVLNEVVEIRRSNFVVREKVRKESNNSKEISEQELSKIEANLNKFK